MAQQDERQEPLDPVQENMLSALRRLCERDPSRWYSYPAICDNVRFHTKGQVVPALNAMKMAKPLLLGQGLIRDGGIGFAITDMGKDRVPLR